MKKFIWISVLLVFIISVTVYAASITNEKAVDEKKESDSIEILTNNKEFMNNNIEIKSITKDVKITREKALDIAKNNGELKYSLNLEKNSAKTSNGDFVEITAVLCDFTDKDIPQLPHSGKSLINCPVWIITYHNIYMERFGEMVLNSEGKYDKFVLADMNIVIDANTGELLETFSYGVNE